MKSFVKKDLLFKKREAVLKKFKKEKKYQIIYKTKKCQYFQINGLKKMQNLKE